MSQAKTSTTEFERCYSCRVRTAVDRGLCADCADGWAVAHKDEVEANRCELCGHYPATVDGLCERCDTLTPDDDALGPCDIDRCELCRVRPTYSNGLCLACYRLTEPD